MSTATLAPLVREDVGPALPAERGPWSRGVLDVLRGDAGGEQAFVAAVPADPLADDDLQLALYLCYELHYAGFAGVDARLEWDPNLLTLRRTMEDAFERALRADVPVSVPTVPPDPVAALSHAIAAAGGPSLSTFMVERGSSGHFREFAMHRSLYQRKEADPHTWAIPRVHGPAKAALAQIQMGEYGDGRPSEVHAELFAVTMRALGLDGTYGAYLDQAPGPTLATVNLISLFGLHRRLRGALLGHLAVFEMTSVEPMARYSDALRRLGVAASARRFYDAHVVADAEHAQVAARMIAAAVEADPELAADVQFGAGAALQVERRFAEHLLRAWTRGQSSLRARA